MLHEFISKQKRGFRAVHKKKKQEKMRLIDDNCFSVAEEVKEETCSEILSFKDYIDTLSSEELEEILKLLIPVVKLSPKMYLIGTKSRQL